MIHYANKSFKNQSLSSKSFRLFTNKTSYLKINLKIWNETSVEAEYQIQTYLHERKTQRRIDQNRLSQSFMRVMPPTLLDLPHIIHSWKVQIQSDNCQIARKKGSLENGQLAHPSLAFLNKIKTQKIWRSHITRLINR